MFDKPIQNIQQAKEYFLAMGCSHFHMGREYPERYTDLNNIPAAKSFVELP
jgi:hypothetical protein